MFECPTVETERLLLRPFHDDDTDRYFEIHHTPEVRASLHLPAAFDRESAWQQMTAWLTQWALRNSGAWAVEWAFAHHDDPELSSCILPDNTASQAVARRLGFTRREERILRFFPSQPHGIWVLPRPEGITDGAGRVDWTGARRGATTGGDSRP